MQFRTFLHCSRKGPYQQTDLIVPTTSFYVCENGSSSEYQSTYQKRRPNLLKKVDIHLELATGNEKLIKQYRLHLLIIVAFTVLRMLQ